ncbi:hypothetical protein KM043_018424 [Ampulex compressa]|nr:hypothetical protein KM043_018424 [Ampulex compressa]
MIYVGARRGWSRLGGCEEGLENFECEDRGSSVSLFTDLAHGYRSTDSGYFKLCRESSATTTPTDQASFTNPRESELLPRSFSTYAQLPDTYRASPTTLPREAEQEARPGDLGGQNSSIGPSQPDLFQWSMPGRASGVPSALSCHQGPPVGSAFAVDGASGRSLYRGCAPPLNPVRRRGDGQAFDGSSSAGAAGAVILSRGCPGVYGVVVSVAQPCRRRGDGQLSRRAARGCSTARRVAKKGSPRGRLCAPTQREVPSEGGVYPSPSAAARCTPLPP